MAFESRTRLIADRLVDDPPGLFPALLRYLVAIVCFVLPGLPAALRADDAPQAEGIPESRLQPLFVSGENGYGRYRIPALIVSPKKTVLAFCEGRRRAGGLTGDIDLVLRRSLDGGRTWQPLQLVADDGENTLGNPCPVIDRDTGTIWLPFTRSPGRDTEDQIVAGTSTGTTTVWVTSSQDDGGTWSKPVEISGMTKRPEWTWYGTGPGVGVQLKNGRLLIPSYHAVKGSGIYRSHAIFSDDHGATWTLGSDLGDHTTEAQCVELADGTVVINARSIGSQGFRTIATSRNGGETWSPPELDRQLPDPSCQGSLFQLDAPNPGEPSAWLFSNPPGPRRRNLTLRLSRDAGRSWPLARVLDAGSSEYSCLTQLPDGTIGCLYERSPGKVYSVHVTFVQISLEWLSRNKANSSGK